MVKFVRLIDCEYIDVHRGEEIFIQNIYATQHIIATKTFLLYIFIPL
jgi:hypothetical protein